MLFVFLRELRSLCVFVAGCCGCGDAAVVGCVGLLSACVGSIGCGLFWRERVVSLSRVFVEGCGSGQGFYSGRIGKNHHDSTQPGSLTWIVHHLGSVQTLTAYIFESPCYSTFIFRTRFGLFRDGSSSCWCLKTQMISDALLRTVPKSVEHPS